MRCRFAFYGKFIFRSQPRTRRGVGEITKSGSASCGVSWVMDKQAAEQAVWQEFGRERLRERGRHYSGERKGGLQCNWGGIFTQLFAAFIELKL